MKTFLRLRSLIPLAVLAVTLTSAAARAADQLAILPPAFTLTGPTARQPLVVETRRGEDFVGEVAAGVEWSSSDPKVVAIKEGVAVPVGNGQAKLTAKAGSQTATADVIVVGKERPVEYSFRNQVQSVFSRAGCNSGACHGAAAGKNGFKLSLRGYDADADWFTITRQARGRRIVPSDPGRSLLLLKPTGALPHKGGVRFEVDSLEYESRGLDRRRRAGADRGRSAARSFGDASGRRRAQAGRHAAAARAGVLHRWPSRRRDALGQVHLVQRIGRAGRSAPGTSRSWVMAKGS